MTELRVQALARAEELAFVGYDGVTGPLLGALVAENDRLAAAVRFARNWFEGYGDVGMTDVMNEALEPTGGMV